MAVGDPPYCVIEFKEHVSLLRYYAGNTRNFLPTFPVNLSDLGDGIDARWVMTQKSAVLIYFVSEA
jgi:hypothetical protein